MYTMCVGGGTHIKDSGHTVLGGLRAGGRTARVIILSRAPATLWQGASTQLFQEITHLGERGRVRGGREIRKGGKEGGRDRGREFTKCLKQVLYIRIYIYIYIYMYV